MRAECSVASHTCSILALHARVTGCDNSAATRERFAATDSETSAAAEQAADATTKTSGAQQVSNYSPDATTHKATTAVKNVSLSRAGVASGAPKLGKLTSYSISSGATHATHLRRVTLRRKTLTYVGSR